MRRALLVVALLLALVGSAPTPPTAPGSAKPRKPPASSDADEASEATVVADASGAAADAEGGGGAPARESAGVEGEKRAKKRASSASASGKRKKRKKRAPPPSASQAALARLSSGLAKLRDGAGSLGGWVKEAWTEPEEEGGGYDEEAEEPADARERDDGQYVYEDQVSAYEKGAIVGSLALSPLGMPGFVVGASIGGAAGYLAERTDRACRRLGAAYGSRLETERRNVAAMASTARQLKRLDKVRVTCDDDDEAAALTQQLVEFLERPCNRKCADCARRLSARNDAWASVNLGVVVCVRCAAHHRGLGVSVSRIKSLVFDRWDADAARSLLRVGNDLAREMYLRSLPAGYAEPTEATDDERVAAFVRAKYARMRWAEPGLKKARRAEAARRSEEAAGRRAVAGAAGGRKGGGASKPARARPMPSLSSDG